MENQLLPYNEKAFREISKQFRDQKITRIIVEPKRLWMMQAGPSIVKSLEQALFRVAWSYGFTKAIREEQVDGTSKIIFVKPEHLETQA